MYTDVLYPINIRMDIRAINNFGIKGDIITDLIYSNLPTTVGNTVASRLKYKRLNNCLTKKELGKLAKICWQTISNIENGKPYKISTIRKLANALNITIKWLGCLEFLPEDTIGQKIKKSRLMHGLSREEAAILMGCDVKSIFNWEHDRKIPVKSIVEFLYKQQN